MIGILLDGLKCFSFHLESIVFVVLEDPLTAAFALFQYLLREMTPWKCLLPGGHFTTGPFFMYYIGSESRLRDGAGIQRHRGLRQ